MRPDLYADDLDRSINARTEQAAKKYHSEAYLLAAAKALRPLLPRRCDRCDGTGKTIHKMDKTARCPNCTDGWLYPDPPDWWGEEGGFADGAKLGMWHWFCNEAWRIMFPHWFEEK